MKQISGDKLSPADQQSVRNRYVYRFTGEHTPNWVRSAWASGQVYPVQFRDDNDWLAHTLFWVKEDNTLGTKNVDCESTPTWPHGDKMTKRTPDEIISMSNLDSPSTPFN
jgi:hypothetical protein